MPAWPPSTARDDPAWAKFEGDLRARSVGIAAESLFFTLELNQLEDSEIEAALKARPAARPLDAVAAPRAPVAAARAVA
jgi:oligoendopeptidase F